MLPPPAPMVFRRLSCSTWPHAIGNKAEISARRLGEAVSERANRASPHPTRNHRDFLQPRRRWKDSLREPACERRDRHSRPRTFLVDAEGGGEMNVHTHS